MSREVSRYFQMNISYNIQQHELYSKKVQEIIDTLISVISLHILLNPNQFTESNISQCKQTISNLYFKHYNYLPQEVLIALNCLFMCLSSNGNYLYVIREVKHNPKTNFNKLKSLIGIKKCKHVEFKQCKKSSDFITEDFKKMILSSNELEKIERILKYPEKHIPLSMKLNLQARYVIYVIHKYYQKPYLQTWDTYLVKHSVFKHR